MIKKWNRCHLFNKYYQLVVVSVLVLFLSCNNSDIEINKVIKEWSGREIRFPENLNLKVVGRDTLCPNILNHRYKILVYVDSFGCAACKLKLGEWKCFLDTYKRNSYDVGYLFVVQTTDYRIIEQQQRINSFNYPIVYDHYGEFDQLNYFPKDQRFHTFLLDGSDRVVLIGSPLNSDRLRKLYDDVICGRKKENVQNLEADSVDSHQKSITSASVEKGSVNIGAFSSYETKCIDFQLRNTGSKPLLIYSANTSCGCTTARYDKEPIPPGKTTTVTLEYKPNSLGYFHKIADVVCNIPEGFVRLSISGTVVEK